MEIISTIKPSKMSIVNMAIHVRKIKSNDELFNLVESFKFDFINSEILKDKAYRINGRYNITWYAFEVENTSGEIVTLAICGATPIENIRFDENTNAIYIPAVEVSKYSKKILGIDSNIEYFKYMNMKYNSVLSTVIEFIENKYYMYDSIRLSTVNDTKTLVKAYEDVGFSIIGKSEWDGYEMEKKI